MMNLNRKRNKRFIGMACLVLAFFLLSMPLMGMASAASVSGNDAAACFCETGCTKEYPNQACPVCKDNAEECKGKPAEPDNTPCFCETKCTKDSHNLQCPACAADLDLCTAQEAAPEEPPTEAVCNCTEQCQEGAVKPDCVLCQTDRTKCVGKAPEEPPLEPVCNCTDQCKEGAAKADCALCQSDHTKCIGKVPEEPPTEPMCNCADKCAAGAVNTACEICKVDMDKCAGKEVVAVEPKFMISILEPDGWYTNRAEVKIRVKDVNETGWETAEAKINSGGSWIDLTDDLVDKEKASLEISENCTVYVTVTDKNGKNHTKNRYIEVFDREAPTLRAGIDGELLRVEAKDDLSGVDQIYVCGNSFSRLNNGTLDIRLKDYADQYEKLAVQATDNAGNKSRMTQLDNPFYEKPKKDGGTSSGSTTPPVSGTVNGGTTSQPASVTTQAPAGQTAKPTGTSASTTTKGTDVTNTDTDKEKDPSSTKPTAEETVEEAPFTPDGSATVVDNATEEQGKEFYTIMTPDENVFYLVIDKQRDSKNVYFLNAVTEHDLMALAQKEESGQPVTPAEPEEPESQEAEELETPPSVEEEPEEPAPKSNNNMMFIVLAIALAAGGAGYYFKIYKPKHELDDAEDIDDFEFEGPEELTVNEDEEWTGSGENQKEIPLSEEEEAEQRRLYEEDNEDIPIEEGADDDLVF